MVEISNVKAPEIIRMAPMTNANAVLETVTLLDNRKSQKHHSIRQGGAELSFIRESPVSLTGFVLSFIPLTFNERAALEF